MEGQDKHCTKHESIQLKLKLINTANINGQSSQQALLRQDNQNDGIDNLKTSIITKSNESEGNKRKYWFQNIVKPGFFSPILCPKVQYIGGPPNIDNSRPEVYRPPSETSFLDCHEFLEDIDDDMPDNRL